MNRIISLLLVVAFGLGATSLSAQEDFLLKADKFYELYAFDLAITQYEKALQKDEKNLVAMAKLANCYRKTNQLENALAWYQKISMSPQKTGADIMGHAKTLQSLGRYQEAKRLFQQYEAANPEVGSHFAASCDYAERNQKIASPFNLVSLRATNSTFADFAPAFYEKNLVFSSFRRDGAGGEGQGFNENSTHQVFISSINSKTQVSPPTLLREGLQASNNQAYARFSHDANTMVFVKTNANFTNGILPVSGSGAKMDIFLAKSTAPNNWEDIVAFPYNDAKSSNGFPYLSDDGKTLYFASNREGGYGGFDIYRSHQENGKWAAPINLGPKINSKGNEISPCIAGNTLYFSSDWHTGFGGMDVFQTEKNGSNWSEISNLGSKINSAGHDYDFIYSDHLLMGFFISNRSGGLGKEDLFKVSKAKMQLAFKVNVINSESEQPLKDVMIDLSSCGLGVHKTDQRGIASIPAILEKQCNAKVLRIGYQQKELTISANDLKRKQMTIKLEEMGTYYVGIVKDIAGKPLQGVTVKLGDRKTGKITKATTDDKGRYSLPLKPSNEYAVLYSKAGFLNKKRDINTESQIESSLLGTVQVKSSPISEMKMEQSPTLIAADMSKTMPSFASSDWSAKGLKEEKEAKSPAKVKETAAVPAEKTSPNPKTATKEIYEIQIGVFSQPNAKKMKVLGDVGMVYSDQKGDLHYYKVGAFKSKNEADDALSMVKKRGFKDAFIRQVKDDNPIVQAIFSISDKEKETTAVPKKDVVYKVQLGAYSNPDAVTFSPSLKKTGKITFTDNGKGITIYLLGDFFSLAEAKEAREIAAIEGVANAFVVAYRDGIKISLAEAQQ